MPASAPAIQKRWRQTKDYAGNFLFILPALLVFAVFSLYPILSTVYLSLFKWNGIEPTRTWVGLRNFQLIFTYDPNWWTAMGNAAKFAILGVVVMQSCSLCLAYLVDRGVRGSEFYKVVFYIPTILSPMVVGYVWKWIYDPASGILNFFLAQTGLAFLSRSWLSDLSTALYAVSATSIWSGFGYSFVFFLAALKGIAPELPEAARVDGANSWQTLRHITLPLLRPVLTVVTILTILGAMQMFPLIEAMTGGGPGFATQVPVKSIYDECFKGYHYGYASAYSVIFGLTMLIISLFQLEIAKRYNYD
jgi:ABC-type sugar transport system permease subunit